MSLVIERLLVLPARPWRFTTRNEWSSQGESMWMRLAKFSWCNRLSLREHFELFARDPQRTVALQLLSPYGWNREALASVLDLADVELTRGFAAGDSADSRSLSSSCVDEVRYCPTCLLHGFHAGWFQLRLVERCPIHRLALRTGCPRCRIAISYSLDGDLANSPLTCTRCATHWIPQLERPAGRCLPMERRANRIMNRWGRYIALVSSPVAPRTRRRIDGRFAPEGICQGVAQVHTLTLMNRYYDAPPPATTDLLSRLDRFRSCSPVAPREQRASAPLHDPSWPHFNGLFLLCEQMLSHIQRKVLGSFHIDAPRLALLRSLDAPADRLAPGAAAALGWAIAWTTAAATLLGTAKIRMPALGLAGWLAGLPLRPQALNRARWREQVLQWLGEDLTTSLRLWSVTTRFMQAKGRYVLRTPVAHPVELAAIRRNDDRWAESNLLQ